MFAQITQNTKTQLAQEKCSAFRLVRRAIAGSDYKPRHVHPSVCPSAYNIVAPIGRILVNFH